MGQRILLFLETTGGLFALLRQTIYWVSLGPLREKTEYRRQVFPLLVAVGNRSFPVVALIAFLIGMILQTGYVLEKYNQQDQVAWIVAISMARELGPLMTAIVLIARVGAAFTAGLGAMTASDEVLALRIMGIDPVGYLVAPRFLAMVAMLPCLTVLANVVGIGGGCAMAVALYHMNPYAYISVAVVISIVSCHMALTVEGGPEGVARKTMLSAVTSLVIVTT